MGQLTTAVLLGLVALFVVLWVVLPKDVSHQAPAGIGGIHAAGASEATAPDVAPHAQGAGEPVAAQARAVAEPPSPNALVSVRGHVALPEGLQLSGACLQATLPDDGRVVGLGAEDGAFDLGPIPRGTWIFRVRLPGGELLAPIVRAIGGPVGDLRLGFQRGADSESNPWIADPLWDPFDKP